MENLLASSRCRSATSTTSTVPTIPPRWCSTMKPSPSLRIQTRLQKPAHALKTLMRACAQQPAAAAEKDPPDRLVAHELRHLCATARRICPQPAVGLCIVPTRPSAELPFRTLFVEPVSNGCYAPQAQALLSAKIRDVLIRDGRVQLVTAAEQADAILSVNLTNYSCRGNSRQPQDTYVPGISKWFLRPKSHCSISIPVAITSANAASANAATPMLGIPTPPMVPVSALSRIMLLNTRRCQGTRFGTTDRRRHSQQLVRRRQQKGRRALRLPRWHPNLRRSDKLQMPSAARRR